MPADVQTQAEVMSPAGVILLMLSGGECSYLPLDLRVDFFLKCCSVSRMWGVLFCVFFFF